MPSTPPQITQPTTAPPAPPRPEAESPYGRHRPGEGVTVIPDTGKRGSRPKSNPAPYPPRPTAPPAPSDTDARS